MPEPCLDIIFCEEPDAVQKAAIRELWNAEYAQQIVLATPAELDCYLEKLERKQHFFLTGNEGAVLGWLLLFRRDGFTWFALIIRRDQQGRGCGRRLLAVAQGQVEELHGWVVDHDLYTKADGSVYRSPLAFYLKEGFELLDDRLDDRITARHIRWHR